MRHTKIVCTIGPASESIETLKKMMQAGMNVARLNFSHGNHQEHEARIKAIRQAAVELNYNIGIMLDTKGPEIRIGDLAEPKLNLQEGRELTLTIRPVLGNEDIISINYPGLPKDVQTGDRILIDDGLIALEVLQSTEDSIRCRILNSGEISSRKGVNVPGVNISLAVLTEKDLEDIKFGIKHGLDFIAPSFIRSAGDVLEIRKILEEHGSDMQIISKIENRAAVNNIDEILQVSDGIMVARGDLGVEIPAEEVPIVQKSIIAKCNQAGKPVITATQMLDSMVRNPRPTRAEANDVANAIFDGSDAVMLSGESAAGKYPVEAVQTMARIAERAEEALDYSRFARGKDIKAPKTVTDSIGHATVNIAMELGAAAIITPTASGSTARMVAKYRPKAPIIATASNRAVMRKLSLVWGVVALEIPQTVGTDEMINTSVEMAIDKGEIKLGDLVVVTAGVPAGIPGTTNLLKVHIVGEAVVKGQGIGRNSASGKVQICLSAKEALAKINAGDVMVARATDRDYVPAMEKAAAVITEVGGLTSHAAIVGLNLGIPVIVGAEGALRLLEEGLIVTVDASRGLVYKGITKVM
ncbi:pyruvate kinase [Zhaonella formicivorans]|uniref:pyruvate kinase n=1 Tax=Zhaonella formicivorans TaxID=2528593 RepID=UPI0010E52282|nr:pyruvate kinase [Zhaonella formicivorans]